MKVVKRTFGIGGGLALATVLSCSSVVSLAQMSLSSEERTNGKLVVQAFEAQRGVLQESSAVLYDGLSFVNYGVVVSADGYLLAKSSELKDRKNLNVRIDEDKFSEVAIVAENARWDLALLKVEAEDLTPVVWADPSEMKQGSWVVANGATTRTRRRATVGIVSANYRAVDGESPVVIGISFGAEKGSLEIKEVTPETGAALAGLKVGDVLTKFAGKVVVTRAAIVEHARDHVVGDKVEVEFLRDGKTLKTEVELMARSKVYKTPKSRNDSMSGDVSGRRDSFPRVMQTDIRFGNGRHIGGPLLNFKGECVGMNIARANRAEAYAIPVKDLREVLTELLESVRSPT